MSLDKSWIIGLTGGIGTGKTRVSELLRELGAKVECADRIVHQLQAPGGRALLPIAQTFGMHYLTAKGELDRERLGERVFRDPAARQKLNAIVHPLVVSELSSRLALHVKAHARVIVLDIPLLLEGRAAGRGAGVELPFDEVVVVYAPEATQLERLRARDGLSEEAALQRIRSQLSIEEKRKLADVVLDNSGDWAQTEQQVRALYARWTSHPSTSATG